jgi:hypothetical protein
MPAKSSIERQTGRILKRVSQPSCEPLKNNPRDPRTQVAQKIETFNNFRKNVTDLRGSWTGRLALYTTSSLCPKMSKFTKIAKQEKIFTPIWIKGLHDARR